jgi:hypothetical protein
MGSDGEPPGAAELPGAVDATGAVHAFGGLCGTKLLGTQ